MKLGSASSTTESSSKRPKTKEGDALSKAEQPPEDGSSPISEIPLELLEHTLSFLPLSKHIELRSTNKQFHQSWNNVFGRQMYQQHGSQAAANFDDWSEALEQRQRKEIDYLLENVDKVLNQTRNAQPVIDAYERMKMVNERPSSYFTLHAVINEINEAIISQAIEQSKVIGYTFYCNDKCLTQFPAKVIENELSFFKQVKQLLLNDNQLTALPENIGQCVALKHLDVANNRLSALPESIGQCIELMWMQLTNNHLSALPEGLGRYVKEFFLFVCQNQFLTLPDYLPDSIFFGKSGDCISKIEVLASQKEIVIPNYDQEEEEEPSLTNRKLKRKR